MSDWKINKVLTHRQQAFALQQSYLRHTIYSHGIKSLEQGVLLEMPAWCLLLAHSIMSYSTAETQSHKSDLVVQFSLIILVNTAHSFTQD